MNYPKEINFIIKEELSALIEMKKSSEFPFNKESIEHYRELFKKIKIDKK
jgi:protein associated with RNAse G/E